MILSTAFTAFGKSILLLCDTSKIDRNYNDENYAYWVVENDGNFFEVNIWKDDNGNFTTNGTVYAFSDREKLEYVCDPDEEIEILFAQV